MPAQPSAQTISVLEQVWEKTRMAGSDIGHHGAPVVHDLPTARTALPDRGAARHALALPQRVGEQVDRIGKLAAVGITGFPRVGRRIALALVQHIEHMLTAVATAGGAPFP